jgi:peptide/nickel transport system substrate-binding protein
VRAQSRSEAGGRRSRRAARRGTAAAVAATAIAVLATCSSSPGSSTSEQPKASGNAGGTLTLSQAAAPLTLDPAKTTQNNEYFEALAYEPLIDRDSDGSLRPGLATSWSYLGGNNTVFQLKLRSGVKFSDGSPLTAQSVVADFKYVVKSAGQFAPYFTGDTFTATGPLTVQITSAKPDPDLPGLLTQDDVVGDMISGAALAHPAKLGTETFGAGPYMLDSAQSVTSSAYTYVPNPNYYDKSAVHWKKVVVKVIADPQSVLNAMKTGEVNFSQGDPSTLAAAKQAGLTVTMAPLLWVGVTLADRDGAMSKPLGSLLVRQALNDATDRAAIATALFPGNGSPTNQVTVPGGYGYQASLNSTYPYDVAKARQLLAQAGYPHGFTLKLVTTDSGGQSLVAQALAQQWKQIGVTLQITDYANSNTFYSAAFAPKFPAFMTVYGQQPIWIEGPGLFLPSALFNPFHTTDATLQSLYDQEARASGAQQVALDQQVEAYMVKQAWFVPVLTQGLPFYATSDITGTSVSAQAPLAELYQIKPAG